MIHQSRTLNNLYLEYNKAIDSVIPQVDEEVVGYCYYESKWHDFKPLITKSFNLCSPWATTHPDFTPVKNFLKAQLNNNNNLRAGHIRTLARMGWEHIEYLMIPYLDDKDLYLEASKLISGTKTPLNADWYSYIGTELATDLTIESHAENIISAGDMAILALFQLGYDYEKTKQIETFGFWLRGSDYILRKLKGVIESTSIALLGKLHRGANRHDLKNFKDNIRVTNSTTGLILLLMNTEEVTITNTSPGILFDTLAYPFIPIYDENIDYTRAEHVDWDFMEIEEDKLKSYMAAALVSKATARIHCGVNVNPVQVYKKNSKYYLRIEYGVDYVYDVNWNMAQTEKDKTLFFLTIMLCYRLFNVGQPIANLGQPFEKEYIAVNKDLTQIIYTPPILGKTHTHNLEGGLKVLQSLPYKNDQIKITLKEIEFCRKLLSSYYFVIYDALDLANFISTEM